MKRVDTSYKCPCGFVNKTQITKPTVIKQSWCQIECAQCGSRSSVTYIHDPNNKMSLKVMSKVTYESEKLKKIRADLIQELKAKDKFKFKEASNGN